MGKDLASDVWDNQLIVALFSLLRLDLPEDRRDRPSWDKYFMTIAVLAAMRSSCLRPQAQVGAVLVLDRQIIATGYNGAPAGTPTCREAGCKMIDGHCLRTVHAEVNALAQAAKRGVSTKGAVIYCTHKPCIHCTKALINAGIVAIHYLIAYRAEDEESRFADELLRQAGVMTQRLVLEDDKDGGKRWGIRTLCLRLRSFLRRLKIKSAT